MGWESSGVVGFDLEPLLEGQMWTAQLKSAYNWLIIGPRGFGALSLRFASVLRCARSSFNSSFIVAHLHQRMDSKEFNPYCIQSCSPFTICLIEILIFSTDIDTK